MDEKLLVSIGLSQNQARAYRGLVLKKSLRPTQLAKLIGESRTNCYALLDKLVELGLATEVDENKKLTYYPASPLVLESILTKRLAEEEARLQTLRRKLPQMLSAYHTGGDQPRVRLHKGSHELEAMYVEQMEQPARELYFIRSKADVPYFGLPTMKVIRGLAHAYKKRRYGVTPILYYARPDLTKDAYTNLKRAWIDGSEYTAPVEWAVSGDVVHAISLKGEGYGVSITHPEIAESFRQIMSLLYTYIRNNPSYNKLPKVAAATLEETQLRRGAKQRSGKRS